MTTPDDEVFWRPCASRDGLEQRANLLRGIRKFMEARDIMEVETPVLDPAGNPDPSIESLKTAAKMNTGAAPVPFYLHTSPEFAMKRLLAAGSGPIYQVCKVFREEQPGRLHQPEFTLLEWYRPGFDHHDLMDETEDLLRMLGYTDCDRASYADVFLEYCDTDPHRATDTKLQQLAARSGLATGNNNRGVLLDFLFSHCVLPQTGRERPLFIYDFPVCQAALARIRRTGSTAVAERFELIINCMEIANGYNELTNYSEQKSRFEKENNRRLESSLEPVPVDVRLLAALQAGLPDCAGVALGLDRLLMCLAGSDNIADVLAFPFAEPGAG